MKSLLRELKCLYVSPLQSKNLIDLPDNISRRKKYLIQNRDSGGETKFEPLVDQLECAAWKWHRSSKLNYEVLTCLATMNIFDFSFEDFSFGHILDEKEIDKLSVTLRENMNYLRTLQKIENKQASVLNIALNNPFETKKVVQFLLHKFSDNISSKFTNCTVRNFDQIQLLKDVTLMLARNHKEKLKLKQNSLLIYFNSIFSRKFKESENQMEGKKLELREDVRSLLEDLGLTEYYPQKIAYDDVIKITEDALTDVHRKPSTLPELPWYFMRRLIGLNSMIREKDIGKKSQNNERPTKAENGKRGDEVSFDWSSDSDEEIEDQQPKQQYVDDNEITPKGNSVHPLDLIYVIFLCADDFLRQQLADKMSKCQYAVPFILPPAEEGELKNTVLNWGLQAICRTYCEESSPIVTDTLIDVCCPLVSCLSLNTNTSWESRLLNKMLSPQQDTFWHEGLEGGERIHKVSQGMVEVSWYLPAGRGNDEFKTPVTFSNLRGDAYQHPAVVERLIKSSTTTCIFANEINKQILGFFERYVAKAGLARLIFILLYNPDQEKKFVTKCRKLKKQLKLDDYQVILSSLKESNFYIAYNNLKSSLEISFEKNADRTSLSKLIDNAKLTDCFQIDSTEYYNGQKAAKELLQNIEGDSIKSKVLPCQSNITTRQDIGRLDKEICRLKELTNNDFIPSYVKQEKEKKWDLQWEQLLYPIYDVFTHFLKCIICLHPTNRKFFLQSLKLGLNEKSIKQLQPIYEEYDKCRLEDILSEERDEKLSELNKKLIHNSFGLEHFFREIAIMYENMVALDKKVGGRDMGEVLNMLSGIVAEILLNGEAIEILDGDAEYSPVLWLKAVLNQIGNREKVRIFKISALGAQSSGKSTLLNILFGQNFPVSSGRCTRGAYMQLVKIDDQLAKRLRCDYLAVIDSEGLMSRVSKNTDHDNELATFVVGLSDLTLVVIKGEGNEMQDVLPIAIHVFLRMNVLGELQDCHFVHQNMGAVDVKKTMPIEIDAFVQLLDEKTRTAAREAGKMKYQKFTDVIHYDSSKDNIYVCGLFDGTPPMGKTDTEYSNTMQRLKSKILQDLEHVIEKKHCMTLGEFSKWLDDIWHAIKCENFVFSFRDVLAVEAHKKVSGILNDKQWEIKKTLRENQETKEKEIKDEIMTMPETDMETVKDLIHTITEKAKNENSDFIYSSGKNLSSSILHYFDCPGCSTKDCSKEVRNRQLLRDYKSEFVHDIKRFQEALEEVNVSTDNLETELTTSMSLYQLGRQMDDILKRRVQYVIGQKKSEVLTEEETESIFDELWKTETDEIPRKITQKLRNKDIRPTVQNTIKTILGPDNFEYNKKKSHQSNEYNGKGFDVTKSYLKSNNEGTLSAVQQLKLNTQVIIDQTGIHYKHVEEGKEFEPKHADNLFMDIQKRIEKLAIQTTLEYKVDLMMHIEGLAVKNFISNQTTYEKNSSPKALLEKRREAYKNIFLMGLGQGNSAVDFSNRILKFIAKSNLEDRLTRTDLLQLLRDHHGNVFKSIRAVQGSIMADLLVKDNFTQYRRYITDYEVVEKEKMTRESIECLQQNDLLKEHAKSKLQTMIRELHDAIEKTVRSSCENKEFIDTLFKNMKGLIKPHNDIEIYKMVTINDKDEFGSMLVSELTGSIQKQLEKDIYAWDVSNIIQTKGLTEFVFNEVVSCSARCPFCKVPCDSHSGGISSGCHRATFHRSRGLGGFYGRDSAKLKIYNCNEAVASWKEFRAKEDKERILYRDYKSKYSDWTIERNTDSEEEVYWKWVFVRFNKSFAKHYGEKINASVKKADIPNSWHDITEQDVIRDLEKNYKISSEDTDQAKVKCGDK